MKYLYRAYISRTSDSDDAEEKPALAFEVYEIVYDGGDYVVVESTRPFSGGAAVSKNQRGVASSARIDGGYCDTKEEAVLAAGIRETARVIQMRRDLEKAEDRLDVFGHLPLAHARMVMSDGKILTGMDAERTFGFEDAVALLQGHSINRDGVWLCCTTVSYNP